MKKKLIRMRRGAQVVTCLHNGTLSVTGGTCFQKRVFDEFVHVECWRSHFMLGSPTPTKTPARAE